jgi:hypothetical protein
LAPGFRAAAQAIGGVSRRGSSGHRRYQSAWRIDALAPFCRRTRLRRHLIIDAFEIARRHFNFAVHDSSHGCLACGFGVCVSSCLRVVVSACECVDDLDGQAHARGFFASALASAFEFAAATDGDVGVASVTFGSGDRLISRASVRAASASSSAACAFALLVA